MSARGRLEPSLRCRAQTGSEWHRAHDAWHQTKNANGLRCGKKLGSPTDVAFVPNAAAPLSNHLEPSPPLSGTEYVLAPIATGPGVEALGDSANPPTECHIDAQRYLTAFPLDLLCVSVLLCPRGDSQQTEHEHDMPGQLWDHGCAVCVRARAGFLLSAMPFAIVSRLDCPCICIFG